MTEQKSLKEQEKQKRFIEKAFPIKCISEHSSREKSIRHRHISTLHIYWARRPLTSSRAANYAALIPFCEEDNLQSRLKFICDMALWESTTDFVKLKKAKQEILEHFADAPPKVLDPFGGGGSIPLEALRLGCETYSNDLNPLAILIQYCTLDYPLRYKEPSYAKYLSKVRKVESGSQSEWDFPLTADIEYWSEIVRQKAYNVLSPFYESKIESENTIAGYIWARTLPCPNPLCSVEIPLLKNLWLVNRKTKTMTKKIAVQPILKDKEVTFELFDTSITPLPPDYNPKRGTISRAIIKCPFCENTVPAKQTRKLFKEHQHSFILVAIVYQKPEDRNKYYRLPTQEEKQQARQIKDYLNALVVKLQKKWRGLPPVPTEPLKNNPTANPVNYGLTTYSDLFTDRQLACTLTFIEQIQAVYEIMLENGYPSDYAKAIATYLTFGISKLVDRNSTLCGWQQNAEKIGHVFARNSLGMFMDFFELNPFSDASGNWTANLDWILRVVDQISTIDNPPAQITNESAHRLPYPSQFFDAIITDPPYYDNIAYSYLSDYFYVWLKRTLFRLYPKLFLTPLTPKNKEIVAYPHKQGGQKGAKTFFEENLAEALKEMNRLLKEDGLVLLVYAHKSLRGWETLINAVLQANFVITAAWPLHTERSARMTSINKAALASSIYLIARKHPKKPFALISDVEHDLKSNLKAQLDHLWENTDIRGPDLLISSIGSALEVLTQYQKILTVENEILSAKQMLFMIQRITTAYVISRLVDTPRDVEYPPIVQFYLLWRYYYQCSKVPFDTVQKLAKSCHFILDKEFNRPQALVTKGRKYCRLLQASDRNLEKIPPNPTLVDFLHLILALWRKNQKPRILQYLQESKQFSVKELILFGQALIECLSSSNADRKLLEGLVLFLVRHESRT